MTKRGTRAPSGMGSVTYTIRGGKKYWTGRVTLGFNLEGEQVRRSFSGYKKTEVIEKMQRALATQNVAGYVDKGDGTLEILMPLWLHQVKAKEIRTTTLAKYDTIIKNRIEGHPYGKMRTRDITIRNLQSYIDTLPDTGCSRNMMKDTLSVMKLFLEYAITIGIIQTNPANYIKLPKNDEAPKDQDKYRIFNRDEQRQIIDALDLEDPIEAMLYLDFFTGLRRSELRGLQWKNYRNGMIYVEQQMRRAYSFKNGIRTMEKNELHDLKTENARRTIALPKIAQNFLTDWKAQAIQKHAALNVPFTEDAFIFSDQHLRPIEEKRANRRLQIICRDLGIEPRPLHGIRHSYATRLFEAGVDIKTVQHLMGHADYKTTLDIYTHVMPEQKEKAVAIFDKLYEQEK